MTSSMDIPTEEVAPSAGGASLWADARRQLLGSPIFLIALFIVLIAISWALFPTLWTDIAKDDCNIRVNRTPPDWFPGALPAGADPQVAKDHIFGTTTLGCDMYSQLVWGARPSIQVGVVVTGLIALIGATLGTISGFYGGMTDTVISRTTDVVLGIPFLLGALLFLALLRSQSIWAVTFVLVALGWTQMTRIVRGSAIQLRDQDFIEAARALGATNPRIILRHIMPNVLAPIVVLSTLYVGTFVAAEATLTFLGVGLQLPEVSWGITIAQGQDLAVAGYPHLLVFPCFVLILAVLSIIVMGDMMRDALDPKGH